jgi:hypothetical protein
VPRQLSGTFDVGADGRLTVRAGSAVLFDLSVLAESDGRQFLELLSPGGGFPPPGMAIVRIQ